MLNLKNPLKTKKQKTAVIISVIVFAVVAIIFWRNLLVFAQSVIDSFNDQTKIAATWNVSTSTAGEIKLASKSCDIFTWFCSASTTCADFLGDGHYVIVAQGDAPSSKLWKSAATPCDQPQCGINGGQTGDNLKADNTLNFTDYPARDYCKSIGGRLPTIDELECIYNNRTSFGSFEAGSYWSSTEYSGASAWHYNWPGANRNTNNKDYDSYVRCVKGW
jgi:hypothetical protein